MTLERRTGLVRTPLAARGVPLKRTSRLEPGSAPERRERPRPAAARRSLAAFPGKVRFLIRVRALDACEACGICLPSGHGQLQHRVCRGMGGSRNPMLGSAVNGVLLCGTPSSGCHGRAEARDPEMHAMGMWLWQSEDPAAVPIVLHGNATLWLLPDGSYSTEPPEVAA